MTSLISLDNKIVTTEVSNSKVYTSERKYDLKKNKSMRENKYSCTNFLL